MEPKKNAAAVAMARKRAESLTPERRSEIAREAVQTRWKNAKKVKKAKKGESGE